MSTGGKILLFVAAILVVFVLFVFRRGKIAWDKITLSKPQLQGLDLQGITLNDIVNSAFQGQDKQIIAQFGMNIKNENNFSIPFGNMKIKFIYDDIVVGETSDLFYEQKFVLPANGNLILSDTVNIQVNKAGAFLMQKLKGNHPQMNYSISVSVFGIPLGWIPSLKNNVFTA